MNLCTGTEYMDIPTWCRNDEDCLKEVVGEGTPGRGPCHGDRGSPLMVKGHLMKDEDDRDRWEDGRVMLECHIIFLDTS